MINLSGQTLTGIKSLNRIDSLEGVYFDIITNTGGEITLKVSNVMDSAYSVFADENYCLVLSGIKYRQECFVSAAYKKDSIWVQDYENRSLFYLNTGLTETLLDNVVILDGTTLQVEYTFKTLGRKEEFIRTKVSLYAYGFYEHRSKSSTGIFFLKDKQQQQESPRKGPLWEYKNKNKQKK